MDTLDALILEVIAKPGDDFPRDVLADYMDDAGRPSEAARIRDFRPVTMPLWHALHICPHRQHPFAYLWLPLSAYGAFAGLSCVVRRGFVEEVAVPADVWKDYGPQLVRSQPIRSVRLTDRSPALAEYALQWVAENQTGYAYSGQCMRDPFQPTGVFPTRNVAEAALSARCVEWARWGF